MIERADRMPPFIGLPDGTDPRAVLADTSVLVIGVGSVGARVALHCARCGVGELTLVDGKRFGPNFATQAIRGRADIGKSKASRVGRWVSAVSPDTTVLAFDDPIEALPWAALERADVAIASTDNLPAEVEAGRRCLALGLALVLAAVHGASLTAQVRTFANRGPDSPCPACAFTAAEWAQLNAAVRFSCDPTGGEPRARITGPPTASVSPLCALAANLAVLELLSIRLGLGGGLDDRVRQYNAYAHETSETRLVRNRDCPVEHTVLDRAEVDRPLAECTLRDFAAATGVHDDADLMRTSFDLEGVVFAERVVCPDCGAEKPHNRFVRRGARLRRRCLDCDRPGLTPHPFYTHDRFVPQRAGSAELCDVPLRSVGAVPARVIARSPNRAAFIKHEPADGGPSA